MMSWSIDLPQQGGALVKTGITVRPEWTGPRPGTGEARPLYACGLVKKELERLEKPNGNCDSEDSSQKNEPPETTGGPWYVVASKPKATSARVPWIAMEDGI